MSKELITVIVAHNDGILAAQHPELNLWEILDSLKKDDPIWTSQHVSTILMPLFSTYETLNKTSKGVIIKHLK